MPCARATKNRACREQVGAALLYQIEQTGLADLRFKCLAQRHAVEADAEAFTVENLRRAETWRGVLRVARAYFCLVDSGGHRGLVFSW